MKVYLVYKNSRSGNVRHVCASREFANDLIQKSDHELMDLVDSFEVEGIKNDKGEDKK